MQPHHEQQAAEHAARRLAEAAPRATRQLRDQLRDQLSLPHLEQTGAAIVAILADMTPPEPRPPGLRALGEVFGGREPIPAEPAPPSPDPAPSAKPPCPRVGGGHRRRYVLRRKLEPLACWPAQYAKLPRRAWDDPRLHQGAKLTLAVILAKARGRRQFGTYTRSLAADARVCERTMHNHLKLLEACGYIITWRASRRAPLLVRVADPATVRHRPLPPEIQAVWALRRSRHPKAVDALAAADRRLRWTHWAIGLGSVGIANPTPRISVGDLDLPPAVGHPLG